MRVPGRAAALLLAGFAFASSGCASGGPRAFRGELPAGSPLRIAVLPVLNLTAEAQASRVVADQLLVELLKRKDLAVVAPGEVEAGLDQLKIRDPGVMTADETREVGEKLNAQILLMGTVTDYRLQADPTHPIPVVSVNLRAVESVAARVVWAVEHSRTGSDSETVFGIGRVTSLPALAGRVVREMVDTFPKGGKS